MPQFRLHRLSAAGLLLRLQDEANRYRATMRTQLLHEKAHSVPHNIITGEARQSPAQLMARTSAIGPQ
jgi:hypothetical protein